MKKVSKYLCGLRKSVTFAPKINKTVTIMLNHSAFYYGFYFYFTSNCEAVVRV